MDHAEGVLLPALHGPHTSIHRTYDSQVGETQVVAETIHHYGVVYILFYEVAGNFLANLRREREREREENRGDFPWVFVFELPAAAKRLHWENERNFSV